MLTRRSLSLLGTGALSSVAIRPVFAQTAGDRAAAFVKSTGDRILGAMRGAGSVDERRKILGPIIDSAIDVDGIARFCLGRFWKNASADQQKRYTELFHKVLIGNITSRLGEYQEVKLTIGRSQPRDDNDIVSTVIERPNNPPATVDWVVANAGTAPKVIDVIAENTSLRQTQRNDYAAYLTRNNNDVDALITAMRAQLEQN
ncbi:MAG: ABC transporter substrate-binding protein [Rhodospirillales bacterium]